jgi:hypothetical protein
MNYTDFILPIIVIFGLYLSTAVYSYILIYTCFQHGINIIPDFLIKDKLLIKSLLSGTLSCIASYLSSPTHQKQYSIIIISFILNFLFSLSTDKYKLTEIFLCRTLFNIFLFKQ